jgi:hypothetical protein
MAVRCRGMATSVLERFGIEFLANARSFDCTCGVFVCLRMRSIRKLPSQADV